MNKINKTFSSIEQVAGQYLKNSSQQTQNTTSEGLSFEEIFLQKAKEDGGVKFSKHASQRLDDRNITLTAEQNERLEGGIEKANEKGIKDSLVLMDSLAFIVNVPNKTVVTAMDQTETQGNIFTNIDGAVII
ncbi:TIGR02530 family flagellar biosynthesis protein [Eubacterium oxidoreducens]|uniref:Flagellar operon protein n=1 Tax=Eubacterium oxidoreducens TaxID=1732 RepID=A0A1G6AQ14_EUBOX|nr:TIGR02530 family flagellar biosynthesis protein [Eubacterium oxidoreducens]SDB10494.1 flagellar operon protein [Eubacterium oxidoreducens]